MYSSEIMRQGKKYVEGFIGVFALDTLPEFFYSRPTIPYRFIVNTQTKNLPGEHWLAISYEKNGVILAFDPMGFYYPLFLVTYLKKGSGGRHRIYFNSHPYQVPGTTICGELCLLFLRTLKNRSLTEKINMMK